MHCPTPQRGRRPGAMPVLALLAFMTLAQAGPAGAESPARGDIPVRTLAASQAEGASVPDAPLGAVRRSDDVTKVTAAEVTAQGAQAAQLLVTADKPIAAYQDFALTEPPRIVLEVSGAADAIAGAIPSPADGPVKGNVRHTQYKERPVPIVRFVVDLRANMPYRVEAAGNQLRVYIGGQLAQAAPPAPAPAAAPSGQPAPVPAAAATAPAPPGKVTRVDVRVLRGRSRVSIGTSGKVTFNITEVSDPPSLVVDIADAVIEPRAARAIEVRQATSPLQRVRSAQHQTEPQRTVRLIAELRSPAKYEVAQVGQVIQLDVLGEAAGPTAAAPGAPAPVPAQAQAPAPPPVTPAPTPAPAAAPPAGPTPLAPQARISMDFKEADVNNLLRIIAEVSGLNVVAGEDVRGRVTIRLINVEWEQALDLILKSNNLAYERDGNVIRVASAAALQREREAKARARAEEERARVEQRRAQVILEPLQYRIIPINYAKAEDVVKGLQTLKTPGRTDSSIAFDGRTNSLLLNEIPTTITRIETLLKTIDRPTPQVMIEARIVEATKTFAQSLGVQWGAGTGIAIGRDRWPNAATVFGTTAVSGNIAPPSAALIAPPASLVTATNRLGAAAGPVPVAVNFPALLTGLAAPAIGFTLGGIGQSALLGMQLSAAEQERKIRTLSAPKVMTLDNIEAEVRQGQQVPYTTIDSSGRTVVAFLDAFIRLKVTPRITNDRRVSMKVEVERTFPDARIDFAGGFAFPLNQRKATTNVLVNNGSTLVLGGLLQTDENYTENRVPFLANIPFLGQLFKSKNLGPDQRIELMIFLTPTIVEEPRLS